MPSITPHYRQLPVQLTNDERMARAMTAAQLQAEYGEVESRKKDTTRELGQRLKALRTDVEKALIAARTGKETQSVQIEDRRNEERRTIETVRLDTGEVIDSRPMTIEERQGKLFGIEGGKAASAKADVADATRDAAKKAAAKHDAAPEDAAANGKNKGGNKGGKVAKLASAKGESGKPNKRPSAKRGGSAPPNEPPAAS